MNEAAKLIIPKPSGEIILASRANETKFIILPISSETESVKIFLKIILYDIKSIIEILFFYEPQFRVLIISFVPNFKVEDVPFQTFVNSADSFTA